MNGAVSITMERGAYCGAAPMRVVRRVPAEVPVAIETNGIAYAVMMATPLDLEDFVTGFLLSEGIAEASEIEAIAIHETGNDEWGHGLVARINLPPDRLAPIMERARRRLGDSSCGICGIESVEAALRPLPKVSRTSKATMAAIGLATEALQPLQILGRETAATHAAAFCSNEGDILHVREDVGRHNALDKLIGALARAGERASDGFILMTSRCSYELVEKAVRADCPLLITISAPTDLAVRRAKAAGLSLAVVARADNLLWVNRHGL